MILPLWRRWRTLQNPHPPAFSAQWRTTWRSCLTGWTPSWQQTNQVSSLMSPPWYRQERGAGHKGQKGPYLYGVHGHKGISGDQFCLPKPANNATRRSWLDKFVLPLGDKTCCPKRNSLIKGELSKEALEAHRKLSRLQNFTLNAAAPLVAALEKLTKKKEPDPTAITSAIQLGLHFLGNVSAQFSVKRCCKALVRLNPDLKSMAEDEDFSQAPPFLFGPGFKKKAKERTDALEYLQKAAAKPNTQASYNGSAPRKQFLFMAPAPTAGSKARVAAGTITANPTTTTEDPQVPNRVLQSGRLKTAANGSKL